VEYLIDNGADVNARVEHGVRFGTEGHVAPKLGTRKIIPPMDSPFSSTCRSLASIFSQDGPSPLNMAKSFHGLDHPVTALLMQQNAVDIERVGNDDDEDHEF
jgi:hypothetical protein